MKRVVIIQPYIPDYRQPLFNGLRDRLRAQGVDLELVTGKPTGSQAARGDASHLDFERPVKALQLRLRDRALRWKNVRRATKGADLVISELASGALENYALSLRRSVKHAVWGHGYAATTRPSRLDSALEHWLMRRSLRFFAYTDRGFEEAISAGVDPAQVTVLNNTVDTSALRAEIDGLSDAQVKQFRADHDLGNGPCCVYIGGLDGPKRIDFLLSAGEQLAKALPGFRLVVGGDGEERSKVTERLARSPWLRYLGRVGPREKAVLSKCADLMLNPGRVGLVAVESFTMGTPIVTTSWRYHAPELTYLVSGVNAVITPDSLDLYVDEVLLTLQDPCRLAHLQAGCIDSAGLTSMESMIDLFADGIFRVLEESRIELTPLAVFVWGNWGHYHYARLGAAAERFELAGIRVEGLEVFAESGVYQWERRSTNHVIHHLNFPPPETRFRPLLLLTRALPLLRSRRPTVVFLPSIWHWSLALNLFSRIAGARVVVMSDSHLETARTGKLRSRTRSAVVKHFHAGLVGGSPHAKYLAGLGLPPTKIFDGYDVVDNDFFARGAAQAQANDRQFRNLYDLPDRYFLSLGRLVRKKNLACLLDAYALLTHSEGEKAPALVIAGGGPEEAYLRAYAESLGLQDLDDRMTAEEGPTTPGSPGVLFRPSVSPEKAAHLYGLALAFVLPSEHEEWGLVVNEAMATGLTVLVSQAAGCCAELVQSGVNGFTFDPANPTDLAACMQMLCDDPHLLAFMSAGSREKIQDWGLSRFADQAFGAHRAALDA